MFPTIPFPLNNVLLWLLWELDLRPGGVGASLSAVVQLTAAPAEAGKAHNS